MGTLKHPRSHGVSKTTIWVCFFSFLFGPLGFCCKITPTVLWRIWWYFELFGPSLNKKNLLKNTPASNANPGFLRGSKATFAGEKKNRLTPHRLKKKLAYGMWTCYIWSRNRPQFATSWFHPSAFKSVKFPPQKKKDKTSRGPGLPKFATFACADDSQLRGWNPEGMDLDLETFGAWNLQVFWEATTRIFLDQHMVVKGFLLLMVQYFLYLIPHVLFFGWGETPIGAKRKVLE